MTIILCGVQALTMEPEAKRFYLTEARYVTSKALRNGALSKNDTQEEQTPHYIFEVPTDYFFVSEGEGPVCFQLHTFVALTRLRDDCPACLQNAFEREAPHLSTVRQNFIAAVVLSVKKFVKVDHQLRLLNKMWQLSGYSLKKTGVSPMKRFEDVWGLV
ncbi:hypothetical protein EVAR_80121_1 [Eumeta japonica]|uniref:Uncharacterized protein n=1 Tax=Eumeta variegata TaxID=151549 RepID=A0A4C1UD19_EUMVA|nr:hypothetical protein EVAR_80121_1 [Eumeta japonica]